MASGRVGGTKSRISGLVGSNIYRVIRNNDGTYSQIISERGERKVVPITPKGRAQQMYMSMVQSLMAELYEVATVSFQSGVNKSKSLNAFSSFNAMEIAEDAKKHWYSRNEYYYPYVQDMTNPGGLYLISSGTLQRDLFDKMVNWWDDFELLPAAPFPNLEFHGLCIHIPSAATSIGDFMRMKGYTYRDSMYYVFHHEVIDFSDSDNPDYKFLRHDWVKVSFRYQMDENIKISEISLTNLLDVRCSYNYCLYVDMEKRNIFVGWLDTEDLYGSDIYDRTNFIGAFSISYIEGRKKVSTARMHKAYALDDTYLNQNTPEKVFSTWMGEPFWEPYPSPY